MSKTILHGNDARRALTKGVAVVADAVRVTIGPRGRNVVFDKGYGAPVITNDGVSIAKEITLSDKFENMGAEIVKEVATKTNELAGDGTTTSIVLMSAITTNGISHITEGSNGLLLRQGIEAATTDAIETLRTMARAVKNKSEIQHVATISAESAEIGEIIASTIETVGTDGVVTVEESQVFGVMSVVVEGLEFATGFVSPYLVTNKERMEASYMNVPVLVTDKKISAIKDVLPLLEKLAAAGKKELVIIAEEIDGEALGTFVLNKMRGIFNVLAIKAPGFGERKRDELQDIATVLGATIVTDALGMALETADTTVLGRAGKIVSTKEKTIIVEGAGKNSAIKERIQAIKNQHKNVGTSKLDAFTKTHLEKRIAKLSNGVAVIRVGAATETEMKYLKLKIEDAVHATRAAIEEGVVLGGGVALAKVASVISERLQNSPRFKKTKQSKQEAEFIQGYTALTDALVAPLRQIAHNAGQTDPESVVEKVQNAKEQFGYDASADMLTGNFVLIDMMKKGIIDPVKVTRTALQNAASAAGILLTTDVAIADDDETIKLSQLAPKE